MSIGAYKDPKFDKEKELPVEDRGQNRQGNGPAGTPVGGNNRPSTPEMIHNRKQAQRDAMNEARAAMGLPPLPDPNKK